MLERAVPLPTASPAAAPEPGRGAVRRATADAATGVVVAATRRPPAAAEVLTPAALAFVGALAERFGPAIRERLAARLERRRRLASGEERLDFLADTADVRAGAWRVPEPPADLRRRIVEITGPASDRKMVINALNSGADVFMADLEDACSPTWHNVLQGQRNLMDAVRGTIAHDDPATGKAYRLSPRTATLLVRPRGLHLVERHLTLGGEPIPGALVDFGLYLFHNAHALLARGSGPYLYLPKLESHREARLWHDVFVAAEDALALPRGTIRATVLIETLPAAFEMDEILHALGEHAAGLNCGRWDYIFSFIKTRQDDPAAVLPDRAAVTMTQPCMRAYTQLAVRTCHRRGAFAIGGMAAQIPVRDDPEANRVALERVAADKRREAGDGHDGTWVAHPALVPIARAAFAEVVTGDDQRARLREDVHVTADDLLRVPEGPRTEEGLRLNVRVGIRYLAAWLDGAGAVPLYNLMEDAATAEISRAQLWQWVRHGARLDDGRVVDRALLLRVIDEEMHRIVAEVGPLTFAGGRYAEARDLFASLCLAPALADFLTLAAYERLDDRPRL